MAPASSLRWARTRQGRVRPAVVGKQAHGVMPPQLPRVVDDAGCEIGEERVGDQLTQDTSSDLDAVLLAVAA